MSNQQVVLGGLAGAAALAAGSGAYGAVVTFTLPTDLPNAASTPTPNAGPITFDVNGDAVNDFVYTFRNPQTATGSGVVWQGNFSAVTAGGTNAILGFQGPFINYGTNLATGTVIGATTPAGASWRNQAQIVLGSIYRSSGTPSPYGGFVNGGQNTGGGQPAAGRGFLGFRFDIGGQTRYGWLDVEVRPATSAANTGGIFFFGGAYDDSGASINAGQVPAPGAVGALALGAVGLLRRSRREN